MTELFSPFGEVTNVDIKRDRITKASLGYAFIQFKVCMLLTNIFVNEF